VQQRTVAEAAEGGEGDGQGKEAAGRDEGRVKAAARTDTMRERGAGDGGRAQGAARQTQVAVATGECSRGSEGFQQPVKPNSVVLWSGAFRFDFCIFEKSNRKAPDHNTTEFGFGFTG